MNEEMKSKPRVSGAIWSVLVLSSLLGSVHAQTTAPDEPAPARRGEVLYEMQCALCHGNSGHADGPASYLLFPPPRDFTRGRFKLAGTTNGVPSDEDLVATLKRGMPGSSMPSWSWMEEEDLQALARYVRELAVVGIAENLRFGWSESEEDLWARARERMTPGTLIDVGPVAEASAENLKRGKQAFIANCAACHGEDGRGRHDTLRRDEDETLNWARDFTAGILKGGASHEELTRRIKVGLHGTAMPSLQLGQVELSALIAYVRSLIPEDAEDRLVQRRENIRAQRIEEGALADGAADVDWEEATEVGIVLAPLWWRTGAVLHARVAAVHDGSVVAIRIRWGDPTPDAPTDLEWPLDAPPYADAAALQLSSEEDPPFFGMGRGSSAANIWHWKAVNVPATEDLLAVLRLLPHRVGEWFTEEALKEMPLYQIAEGPLQVAGETVSAAPAGMKILDQQEALPPSVAAFSIWNGGTWEVTLTRQLEPGSPRELPLAPGSRVSVNFAIWNGAVRDLRGQKSVTIWHTLELDR